MNTHRLQRRWPFLTEAWTCHRILCYPPKWEHFSEHQSSISIVSRLYPKELSRQAVISFQKNIAKFQWNFRICSVVYFLSSTILLPKSDMKLPYFLVVVRSFGILILFMISPFRSLIHVLKVRSPELFNSIILEPCGSLTYVVFVPEKRP
jgi:hypothetical protein